IAGSVLRQELGAGEQRQALQTLVLDRSGRVRAGLARLQHLTQLCTEVRGHTHTLLRSAHTHSHSLTLTLLRSAHTHSHSHTHSSGQLTLTHTHTPPVSSHRA